MLPTKDYKPTPRREARTVTEDIVFSSQQKVWSFQQRSLEFIAGLLFSVLALGVVPVELPECNEGD
jgi:hypothetical protein